MDARSLRAFRISLGALVVYDVCDRARDFSALYTNAGVLGSAAASPWTTAGLFLGAGLAGAALLAGWRSRAAAFAAWALMRAIQGRYSITAGGGDHLIAMLLFWSAFAPLERRRGQILHIGTVCLLGQGFFIHWFAGVHKTSPEWLDLSAVRLALGGSAATAWGWRLGQVRRLMPVLAWAVPRFEEYGSLLLFCPALAGQLRIGLVAGFLLMQASFGLCLDVGNFPWAVATAMLVFIPGRFWGKDPGPPAPMASAPLEAGLSMAVLAAFFAASASAVGKAGVSIPLFAPLDRVADSLGLEQAWDMFTMALGQDEWLVGVGTAANGRRVDLLRPDGRPPVIGADDHPWPTGFKDRRWRAYWRGLAEREGVPRFWAAMADDLCRQGAAFDLRAAPLARLDFYFDRRFIGQDGAADKPRRRMVFSRACAVNDARLPAREPDF